MECPVSADQDSARQRCASPPAMRAHLEASVRASPDAIIGTDHRGDVISWNMAAERLYGHTSGEAIGQSLITLITPYAPDAVAFIADALTGDDVPDKRIWHTTTTGTATQWSLSLFVSRDDRGDVLALSTILHSPADDRTIGYPGAASSAEAIPFGSIVGWLPVAVFLMAPDARQTRIYASPAITVITGFSPEEFAAQSRRPGWHWTESVHPQDRARVAAEDAQSVAARAAFQMEYRYIRKDGSVVWVRDICVPIHDAHGALANWLGMLIDITGEVETARSQAHLAAIVEAAHDAILSTDRDGTILSWNEGATRIFGYTADEAIGQPIAMLRPPELASRIGADFESVWDGAVFTHYETKRLTRDGRRIPVSLTTFPIRNADGEIVAASSITYDLSPLRNAEAAERLRNRAMDAAQSGIFIMDPTLPGRPIVDINPAFTLLTGYSREEIIGRDGRFLQGPDTDGDTVRRLEEAIAEGRDTTETILNYRRDGTPFWISLSLAAVRDTAGSLTHFVGVFHDVTDRVRLEQDLRIALAAAEAANATKALFLAMMSHELRTPLQSIIGYADFLLEPRSDPLTRQQRDDVLAISQGAHRMSALVGQLLELARREGNPLAIWHEYVELAPILDLVLRELAPQIAARRLDVTCDMPKTIPAVLGDTEHLYQILSSIIGNAVKFTHEGSIQITAQCLAGEVAVHVKDTGIGISDDHVGHIFEAFHQEHDGLTRPYDGAGLGLTIAERLVKQLHGRITVLSASGAGSTFTVWLPAADGTDGHPPPK